MASGQVRPDAVVADVRMPDLDGVALLQRIKAHFPAIPVFLVSAFPDEMVWSTGLRAGAADVFPKPIHGASQCGEAAEAMGADWHRNTQMWCAGSRRYTPLPAGEYWHGYESDRPDSAITRLAVSHSGPDLPDTCSPQGVVPRVSMSSRLQPNRAGMPAHRRVP
jgi:CheY-like chemotaxis protein